MDAIDIPAYFLCPISLQLMRDPVTVSTGITYDRESIEKWLFTCKNNTCPVTKQVLMYDSDLNYLTPNHTLRRLIQSWCIINASHGVERIPTPKQPIDKTHIVKLLNDAKDIPDLRLKCLRRLKSIAIESERNRICFEAAGAVQFLFSILIKTIIRDDSSILMEENDAREEVLSILYHLKITGSCLKKIVCEKNGDHNQFVESLVHVMKQGSYQSRAYATMIVKSIFEVADPIHLTSIKAELFVELVRILSDQISQEASKAALKLLAELCPWGRNRIKAVEGGAVPILIELLLDGIEKRACELVLIVLDQLCGCAEGRSEVLKHGAGLAIVSKKIHRVSHVASNRAVRILSSICRFSANSRVLQEMLQVGVVTKLCLVLQVDGSFKTKERAKEILKLHSRVWRNSSCIPSHLLYSYPSS